MEWLNVEVSRSIWLDTSRTSGEAQPGGLGDGREPGLGLSPPLWGWLCDPAVPHFPQMSDGG